MVNAQPVAVTMALNGNGIEMRRSDRQPAIMTVADWESLRFDGTCVYNVVVEMGSEGVDIDDAAKEGLNRVLQRFPQLQFQKASPAELDNFCRTFGPYVCIGWERT